MAHDSTGSKERVGEVVNSPFAQFQEWFAQATHFYQATSLPGYGVQGGDFEVNGMCLSAVDPITCQPSARIVLLKGVSTTPSSSSGFRFYTNLTSRKGRELLANPQASLLFLWNGGHRQIRVEGRVQQLNAEESDAYFQSRPLGSRIGAWASPQSQPIPDRNTLDTLESDVRSKFGLVNQSGETKATPEAPTSIPRPPFWGGFVLIPDSVEFYEEYVKGDSDILPKRQRLLYSLDKESGSWVTQYLDSSRANNNSGVSTTRPAQPTTVASTNMADMRMTYDQDSLLEESLLDRLNPLPQFHRWHQQAKQRYGDAQDTTINSLVPPTNRGLENRMSLTTACRYTMRPSSRTVILRTVDSEGAFHFHTNMKHSRKVEDLSANPKAALTFWWGQRQVRIEGNVEKVIAVGSSEKNNELVVKESSGLGTFKLVPTSFEFWQGRPSRLHDRIKFTLEQTNEGKKWVFVRLAP